jgi:hypothetical protein
MTRVPYGDAFEKALEFLFHILQQRKMFVS